MKGWNRRNRSFDKFFLLSNGQYLKIDFREYDKEYWNVSIVIADSKRKCNDALRKSFSSPKNIYGRVTGTGTNVGEILRIAKSSVKNFEEWVSHHNRGKKIRIYAANHRLMKIYCHIFFKEGYVKGIDEDDEEYLEKE